MYGDHMRRTFDAQRADVVKVVAVQVRVHAEEPPEQRAHRVAEVSREGHACMRR